VTGPKDAQPRLRVTKEADMIANAVPMSPTPLQGAMMPILPSEADLSVHRPAMLRFARRKMRDADLAEDAVQDALVAALGSRDSFKGQSALRTWLIGILNHKIQDAFRRETRYVRVESGDGGEFDGAWLESGTDARVHADAVISFDDTDPVHAVSRHRMHEQLALEIDALPPTLKEVFRLQALEGVRTEEVCRRLGISEANCWVRLHRARKRLAERMSAHMD
jgi:RNA polymerase sigma-70 factor (ECF subfamily)